MLTITCLPVFPYKIILFLTINIYTNIRKYCINVYIDESTGCYLRALTDCTRSGRCTEAAYIDTALDLLDKSIVYVKYSALDKQRCR